MKMKDKESQATGLSTLTANALVVCIEKYYNKGVCHWYYGLKLTPDSFAVCEASDKDKIFYSELYLEDNQPIPALKKGSLVKVQFKNHKNKFWRNYYLREKSTIIAQIY